MIDKRFEYPIRVEICIGLFLSLVGAVVSFLFGVIPLVGPAFGIVVGLVLGYCLGWVASFWPRFLGSFGVLAGLFASSVFRFGLDKRTIALFIVQCALFSYGFYKSTRCGNTEDEEHDGDT